MNGDADKPVEAHPSPGLGGPSMPPPGGALLETSAQPFKSFPNNLNPYSSVPTAPVYDSRWRQPGKGTNICLHKTDPC